MVLISNNNNYYTMGDTNAQIIGKEDNDIVHYHETLIQFFIK